MTHNALGRLHDFALFVRSDEDLQDRLGELAGQAASATHALSCSIMLLSEGEQGSPRLKLWASSGALSPLAWEETPGRGEAIAGRVLENGAPVLIADIATSEYAPRARRPSGASGASFICTPIIVANHVVGVMNLCNRAERPPFDRSDLQLAEVIATLIGKCVQVDRMQTLLRSRVAHISLAKQEKEAVTHLTDGTASPARIAKLLAKSFFRDLTSAGFGPGQIIEAASEIISLVSRDLNRLKNRSAARTREDGSR